MIKLLNLTDTTSSKPPACCPQIFAMRVRTADRAAQRQTLGPPGAGPRPGAGSFPTGGYGTQERARVPGEGKGRFWKKVNGRSRRPRGFPWRRGEAPTDALLTVGALISHRVWRLLSSMVQARCAERRWG
jgi:hypothetical protein